MSSLFDGQASITWRNSDRQTMSTDLIEAGYISISVVDALRHHSNHSRSSFSFFSEALGALASAASILLNFYFDDEVAILVKKR
jgi:hypothetical protein